MSFDGAHWSGEDEQLVRGLELLTPRDQYSPACGRPDPDLWFTDQVIAKLRALGDDVEILEIDPAIGANSDAGAGVVF